MGTEILLENYLGHLGLVSTNVQRIVAVLSTVHKAVAHVSGRQMNTLRSFPEGLAMIQLANLYGRMTAGMAVFEEGEQKEGSPKLLSESQRKMAIAELVENSFNQLQADDTELKEMLELGHRGFTDFTDSELLTEMEKEEVTVSLKDWEEARSRG